jgi:PAS domain S-box-containing protein
LEGTVLQTKKRSLRASEQLFRSIFENAKLGIGIFKIESQEHISNHALQEMLGCTQEQLSHLAQWDEIVPALERVACAEGYMELVPGKRQKDEYEQHFIRRDGSIFLGNGRFQLLIGATGKPEYILAFTEDITERKRAEEALQGSEKLFPSIFENAQIGISIFGIDSKEHICNRALEEMLGYPETRLSLIDKAAPQLQDVTDLRILLVEDNEINRQVATELLESAGAHVQIANHGGEAVKILTSEEKLPPFDVVLMDLQMPEMDGITATKLLRTRSYLRELPIIAMTAHAMVEERQRCLEAGMNDHVSKPIEPDVLFATLIRWVKPEHSQNGATEVNAVAPTHKLVFPEIDGVDVVNGLKRVAGNRRLYSDLLARFAAKRQEVHSQISSAVEAGDRILTERIVHTVKGVAGNIGLNQVCSCAERLERERAFREEFPDIAKALEEFTAVLNSQVDFIQQALHDSVLDLPEKEEQKASNFDRRKASAAILHLKALLESGDGDAAEAFVTLEEALAGTCDKSRLSALGAAMSEFNYDVSLFKLDEIAKQYGANWKHSK